MIEMKHGQRVGVVVAGGHGKMVHLGCGTYTHDRVPTFDEKRKMLSKMHHGLSLPNIFGQMGLMCPVISLDSGGEIYSCECKLCTEEVLKEIIENKDKHKIEAFEITIEELWEEGKLEELLGGKLEADDDTNDIKVAI